MLRALGVAVWLSAALIAWTSAGAGPDKGKPFDPAKLFQKLDVNSDGRLSREEFLRLADRIKERLGNEKGAKIEKLLEAAFDRFDRDKKGLTPEQFQDLLRQEAKTLRQLRPKKGPDPPS